MRSRKPTGSSQESGNESERPQIDVSSISRGDNNQLIEIATAVRERVGIWNSPGSPTVTAAFDSGGGTKYQKNSSKFPTGVTPGNSRKKLIAPSGRHHEIASAFEIQMITPFCRDASGQCYSSKRDWVARPENPGCGRVPGSVNTLK